MKLNMKINRLFLVAALGVSTLAVTEFGQSAFAERGAKGTHEGRRGGPRGGPRGRGHMMERMAQELNLSSSQKTRLQNIMKESRERGRKIRENTSLSQDQKRTKMRENRMATKKRMDAVLTSDQKKKLAAMRSKMRAQRGPNGNRPYGGHRSNGGQRKPI